MKQGIALLEFMICDWILENQSKLHIRSFEGSKHKYEIYTRDASIYHLSDNLAAFKVSRQIR